MHRKIRAVVEADSVDEAVSKSMDGLENAMDDEILADGTLQTLAGGHHPLGDSTYFDDGREQAGFTIDSDEGQTELEEALEDMLNHMGKCFIFTIDERDELTATPVPTENAYNQLVENVRSKSGTYWVITFDLRYDFDAVPHKPYEILDRD